MNTLNIILIFLLVVCCLKWAFLCLFFFCFILRNIGKKCNGFIQTIFNFPINSIERLLHKGGERWFLFQVGTLPSIHIRKFIYKCLGAKIGPRAIVHFKTEIRKPELLSIGEGSIIGDNCILDARRELNIGRNVNISSNVSIYTLQHDYRDPYFGDVVNRKLSIEIEDRVWLGANVIVLPGVKIGEGAVCCAGCVVCKDVEPYTVVAGIPAKQVAERPRNLRYNFSGYSVRLL